MKNVAGLILQSEKGKMLDCVCGSFVQESNLEL